MTDDKLEVELIDKFIAKDSFGVVTIINGYKVSNTFPRREKWFEEIDGEPRWVEKMRKLYKDRYEQDRVEFKEADQKLEFGSYK